MLSDKTVELVKNTVKIKDIVEGYVHLKRSGNRYVGCCPFHNERTPSFFISEEGNFYKCFGCGEAGDSITFIEKIENVNFIEAIEIIAKKYNINIETDDFGNETEDEIKYKEKKSLGLILKAAENLFKENLKKEELAINYLKKRNLDEKTLDKFNIGYSNGNLYKYFEQNGYNIELTKKLGLLKYNNTESFRNRIIIPIHNSRDIVVGFGARIINSDTAEAKYINSIDNVLFHKSDILFNIYNAKDVIFKENNAYLVEGYFDVISLYKIGIKNTVASCGTSLTDNQCILLKKYTNLVTIFYDNDEAGKKATMRAIGKLLKNGLMVNVVVLSIYKDPDEVINSLTIEESKTFIKSSEMNLIDFLISYFNYKNELNINKKNDILHIIRDLIKLTKDDIYKKLLLEKLNESTRVCLDDKRENKTLVYDKYDENEIIEQYENEIIATLLRLDIKNDLENIAAVNLLNKLENYKFKNEHNSEIFRLIKNSLCSTEQQNVISLVDKVENNDVKKKIILYSSGKYDDIISNWVKYLKKNKDEIISKKEKNICTMLLKIKLYCIKYLLKEKKKLIKKCCENENKNELINSIMELKKEENRIANILNVVIF